MKTDIEIARETKLKNIREVAAQVGFPDDEVFNYEASTRDSFMNLLQSNCVKVYYLAGKRKQTALCRPRDPERFVEALRQNCPEFEMQENSKLEVFFDKHEES